MVYLLDYWEGEELHIKLDGETVKKYEFKSKTDHFINFCGNFTYDKNERFSIEYHHVDPYTTLELSIVSPNGNLFNDISRSFGLSEISLDLLVQCQVNSIRIDQTSCQCVPGFYKKQRINCLKLGYNNNFCFDCITCPTFCELCESEQQCTKCIKGLTLINGACTAPDGKKH